MQTSNITRVGLHTDANPKFQPEGSYRFALNSVLETSDGEVPSLSNELGNLLCEDALPEGTIPIGHVLTDTNDIVLFLYSPEGNHEIGVFNTSTLDYTTNFSGECLNFSDKHPVSALFRVRNGCEKVVYFTDNYNPYRTVNLTDFEDFADENGLISDCSRIKVYRDYTLPCFNLFIGEGDIGINDTGGNLMDGVYYFSFRLLDSELNSTDWIWTTRPVAIGDELYEYTTDAATINIYDGGSNVPTSPYYKAPSNKSIRFTISKLNTSFKFYQVAVVKRTGDAGEISSVDVLYPIPIKSASDATFIYTGYDSQIQYQTSVDEILNRRQPIDIVASHAQVDNRLYIANTTNTTYDWSLFQREASKIKTEWLKDDITSPVDAYTRQGKYYFQDASFMEDEVYALGIVYIMENGTESPVFHIPGRAPDVVTGSNPLIGTNGVATDALDWDTGETTYGNTGFTFSRNKRWQNISTATKYASGPLSGLMGYHEATTEVYPEVTTCDGESYWGQDWQGNDIEEGVTKIRHHRMPGPELRPASALDSGQRVGIKFTNVEYPQGAVAHFFVYGDRTFERTILAKGALIPLDTRNTDHWPFTVFDSASASNLVFDPERLKPEQITLVTSPSENVKTYAFLCSEGLLKDKAFHGSYFRLEKFAKELEYSASGNNEEVEVVPIDEYSTTLSIKSNIWNHTRYTSPSDVINYKIEFTGKIPKATYGSKVGTTLHNPVEANVVQNNSFNISPQIITLEDQIDEWITAGQTPVDEIILGSIKVVSDPFTNLYGISYKRMGNCPQIALSTSTIFSTYSGDTFVSRVHVTDYNYGQSDANGKTTEVFHMSFLTQDTGIAYEMRHGSIDPNYSYFQSTNDSDADDHSSLRKYMISKYYENTDDIMELYAENPGYNDSYSFLQSLETYLPAPFNFEYCNECAEKFPYRIYYSEKDNEETQSDNYRIFRPNNYKNLDGSTGEITDLFVNFDQLYARTVKSIYHLHTKPQEIKSDSSGIYLGTGEVLSLPPQQLKTSDFAFGGGRFFKSRVSTEYGNVFVDDISSRPFLLTNQLNDLSNQGMRNFWQENGQVNFMEQFTAMTGLEYPFKTTTSPIGVGYISTYDPRFKRVIIHKRDFKLLPVWVPNFVYVDSETDDSNEYTEANKVWFNNFSFYYNDGVTQRLIDFDNGDFFENKSFTISYSFVTNTWVSFHSYLPPYSFNGNRDFYTANYDVIYKHNAGEFTTFNGQKYPHILDIIAVQNPQEIKITNGIVYTSRTHKLDDTTGSTYIVPETFTSLIAYNSNQTTGELELILKDAPFFYETSTTSAVVAKTDKQYRINNLRDITLFPDLPIWSSNWNHLKGYPFDYIDKVPNPNNINPNKSEFESPRLRDYYVGVRLFFEPTENLKISTDIINTVFANRNR